MQKLFPVHVRCTISFFMFEEFIIRFNRTFDFVIIFTTF